MEHETKVAILKSNQVSYDNEYNKAISEGLSEELAKRQACVVASSIALNASKRAKSDDERRECLKISKLRMKDATGDTSPLKTQIEDQTY